MKESTLHSQLKSIYTAPGAQTEAWVEGFQVDVFQKELVIEIQTGNFSAIKRKLQILLPSYTVLLVYPIVLQRWIVHLDELGQPISRRRSPRKGKLADLFYELVYITDLVNHPNLMIELITLDVEEARVDDGKGSWRRHGSTIVDRRIINHHSSIRMVQAGDYRSFIPEGLPLPFTISDFAIHAKVPYKLAAKMVYCLTRMNLMYRSGKSGRVWLYFYGA